LAAAYNNLGKVYAHEGKMDQALARFRQAIDLDPNFAAAYKNLGLALASQGKKEKAEEMLKKAMELKPGDQETQQILHDLKNQGNN